MKKIMIALVLLSTLMFAKIDITEAMTMNVQAMKYQSKVSLEKVCVDGKLFVLAVSSTGLSITQVLEYGYSFKALTEVECKNGN